METIPATSTEAHRSSAMKTVVTAKTPEGASPAPHSQAVIAREAPRFDNVEHYARAARAVVDGDMPTILALGFTRDDLPALQNLTLAALRSICASGRTLLEVVRSGRLLKVSEEVQTRMIELGAPRVLMSDVFGMSTRKFQRERTRLKVKDRRGRASVSIDQHAAEHHLWRLWLCFADEARPGQLRCGDGWLLMALETGLPIRTIYAVVHEWASEPWARDAMKRDLRTLPADQRYKTEDLLRGKHNLPLSF